MCDTAGCACVAYPTSRRYENAGAERMCALELNEVRVLPCLSGLLERCPCCRGQRWLPFVGLDGFDDRKISQLRVCGSVRGHMSETRQFCAFVQVLTCDSEQS